MLWTPAEMLIERIKYEEPFMMANLVKLKALYFDHFFARFIIRDLPVT